MAKNEARKRKAAIDAALAQITETMPAPPPLGGFFVFLNRVMT
jgi:hypothetical protein